MTVVIIIVDDRWKEGQGGKRRHCGGGIIHKFGFTHHEFLNGDNNNTMGTAIMKKTVKVTTPPGQKGGYDKGI